MPMISTFTDVTLLKKMETSAHLHQCRLQQELDTGVTPDEEKRDTRHKIKDLGKDLQVVRNRLKELGYVSN